ncbi:MAG: hypothetical protein ACI841_001005, partial [Planctomycetota bacterium]
MRHISSSILRLTALCSALAVPASAQVKFSIDWNGPTVGVPDCAGGPPITEADILGPCAGVPMLGPLAPPRIVIPGGALGIPMYGPCVGHPGGTICGIELDALSFGLDSPLMPTQVIAPGDLLFSVDEYSGGMPGSPSPPAVWTEFGGGDGGADAFTNIFPLPPGPLPPFASPPGNTGIIDGDGLALGSPFSYPGLGLKEPNPPTFAPATPGDNLDALDLGPLGPLGAFYSLDSGFIDPCTGLPNGASAMTAGFSGADVLVTVGAGLPAVYAPAPLLGLDLIAGPDSDDLDALALWENGDGVFTASMQPYDWAFGAGTDMLLFSVRRGSAVIGAPDSATGTPIEEGDILTTPIPTFMGGVSPFPAIFIAAENIGLGTLRSGTLAGACNHGDELDALDVKVNMPALHDCNGNGVEDAIDIFTGTSPDVNMNGIPDGCELAPLIATPYCFCAAGAPCGNIDPTAGCRNSTGAGALLSASGSSSVTLDDMVLTVSSMPTFQFGIVYYGAAAIGPFPFGDGQRCVGGGTCRLGLMNSGAAG